MSTRLLRSFLAAVVVAGLGSSIRAESVPSFSLDYAVEHATHVVVVSADGAVLESWRGDLAKGATVPYKASQKPLTVVHPFPDKALDPNVASVTGSRRVLFLSREKNKEAWIPVGFLSHEQHFATVWIEKGQRFAIYQFVNPGPDAQMHPLYVDEQRLKQEVLGAKDKTKGENERNK